MYADQVAKRVLNIEDQERQAELKKFHEKQQYQNSLTQQIKTEKQRKKYDILMTEHERRVHDKSIKAYEHFDSNANEGSGVTGLGQHYSAIQKKIMGKAFG